MYQTTDLDLPKFSSIEEVRWVHGCNEPGKGFDTPRYFSISGSKTGRKRDWRDSLINVVDIDSAVQATRNLNDVYFSQASFRSNVDRKISSFQQVKVCWVDIDMYDPTYDHDAWNEIKLKRIIDFSKAVGIPEPSLIINSGRGAYVKWVFKSATNSLPVWNSLQESLTALYMDLHVDVRARDASRVFRLLDTFNSKNFSRVNVLHQNNVEYEFLEFAKQIQSIRVDELDGAYIKGTTKSRRTTNVMKRGAAILEGAAAGNLDALSLYAKLRAPIMLEDLSEQSLHWRRFCDLRDLVQMRGGFRKGERDQMLLWMSNSLAQAQVITPQNWDSEINSLIEGFPVGPDFDPIGDGYLTSVKTRLVAQTNWSKGAKNIPSMRLYRPRNQHLIDVLQITSDEQTKLTTIIGTQEKNRRLKTKRDKKYSGRSERRQVRETWKDLATKQMQDLVEKFNMEGKVNPTTKAVGFNVSAFAKENSIDRTLVSKHCSAFLKTFKDSNTSSVCQLQEKVITEHISDKDVLLQDATRRCEEYRRKHSDNELKVAHKIGDVARKKLVKLRDEAWAHEKLSTMLQVTGKECKEDGVTPIAAPSNMVSSKDPGFKSTKPTESDVGLEQEIDMATANVMDRLRSVISKPKQGGKPVMPQRIAPVMTQRVVTPPADIKPAVIGGSTSVSERLANLVRDTAKRHKDSCRPPEPTQDRDGGIGSTHHGEEGGATVQAAETYRLPSRMRPERYPPGVQWRESSLPCGSSFNEAEWAFARQDGRYWVVEVHRETCSLERYFNTAHPDNSGVTESCEDVYGVIHHIHDPLHERFIRSVSDCCLILNRSTFRMPEATESTKCVMAGESYWVVRPRNQYSNQGSNYSEQRHESGYRQQRVRHPEPDSAQKPVDNYSGLEERKMNLLDLCPDAGPYFPTDVCTGDGPLAAPSD